MKSREVSLMEAYETETLARLSRCEGLAAHMYLGCDRGVYDQLHQEFDSLSSAARAVDRSHEEVFFFELARYIRFLRDARVLDMDGYEHALITFSISLYRQYSTGEIPRATYAKAAATVLSAFEDIRAGVQALERSQTDTPRGTPNDGSGHE